MASPLTEDRGPDVVSLIMQRFPDAALFFLKVDRFVPPFNSGERHPVLHHECIIRTVDQTANFPVAASGTAAKRTCWPILLMKLLTFCVGQNRF